MWAIPDAPRRPTSAWALSGEEKWSTARLDEVLDKVGAEPSSKASVLLEDPPWVGDDEWKGTEPSTPWTGGDHRPPLPTVGLSQRATTLQLVKQGGKYTVVLDGVVAVGDREFEYKKFWLPRFHELDNENEGGGVVGPRVVGPLAVTLRLEEDEVAPARVTVRVLQSMYDLDVEIMGRQVVLEQSLEPHGVGDLFAPYTLLPYPASITRQPWVTIIDNNLGRAWKEKRKTWETEQVDQIINTLLSPLTKIPKNQKKLWRDLFAGKKSRFKVLWKYAFFSVSAVASTLLSASIQFKNLKYDGFESKNPRPTQAKKYDYSIDELTLAFRRMAGVDSALNGDNVAAYNIDGYEKEGALLQWITSGTVDTVKEDPSAVEKSSVGDDAELESSVIAQQDNNQLNTFGLDPPTVRSSRIDYVVQVTIEENRASGTEQKVTVYEFQALQSNATDAGYVMLDITGKLARLKAARDKALGALKKTKIPLTDWLYSRIFRETKLDKFEVNVERIVGSTEKTSGTAQQQREKIVLSYFETFLSSFTGSPDEKLRERKVLYEKQLELLQRRYVATLGAVYPADTDEGGVEGGLNPSRDFWRWIEHNLQYLFGPLLEAEVNWAEPEPPSPRVAPSLVDLCLSPLAQVPP